MIIVGEGTMFFDTYYSRARFAVETSLAVVSIGSNALMLLLTRGNRNRRHYSYFAFFRNLLIANVLSAFAQWFTNNIMYFFNDNLSMISDHCHLMMILLTAHAISKVFGSVSVISLLGLSAIHCLAVCYPIAYVVRMNTTRVHVAIALSWVLTSSLAAIEVLVCAGRLTVGNCTTEMEFIDVVTLVDTDVTMISLTLMYIIIIGLCLRIAAEIRRLQLRLNRLCWTDNLQQERGTFRSIVGLSITMILFVFPYHVLYFLSMNFDLPLLNNTSLLYYMNLLPYIKFASDPIFFCRKRIVEWRNVGCIFSLCRKPPPELSRDDRALMEDNNFSGVTVAHAHEDSIGVIYGKDTIKPETLLPDNDKLREDTKDVKVTLSSAAGYVKCANTSLV